MRFRQIFGILAFAAPVALAPATTVTVDGVGGGGNFATVAAGIASLGAAGRDGVPDTVNVIVDSLTSQPGILINGTSGTVTGINTTYSILTDPITIDGDADANGTSCTMQLGSAVGGTAANGYSFTTPRFGIELAPGQTVTVKNFVLIPAFQSAGNVVAEECFYVDEGFSNLSACGVTLQNLLITACEPGNIPIGPDATPSANANFWGGNATTLASCVCLLSNNASANSFTHNMTDVVCAHGRRDELLIACDAFATGAGVVNLTRCRFTRTVQASAGDGIFASTAENTQVNMTDVVCNYNDEHGLNATLSSTNANVTQFNIGPGCSFSNNSFRGLSFGVSAATDVGRNRVVFSGTAAKPVVVANNSNRGIRTELTSSGPAGFATQFGNSSYLYVFNNSVYGVELNEFDHQYPTAAGPTFTNCIFARNGDTVADPANFRVNDTNTAAGGFSFSQCTFHDPGRTAGTVAANVRFGFASTNALTYNFNDCIFTGKGDSGVDTVAGGSVNNFVFTNSDLATSGPDALANVTVLNATTNTISLTNVGSADPVYASTTLPTANAYALNGYLNVRNGSAAPNGLAGAGSASANLAGGATFVGDAQVRVVNALNTTVTLSNASLNATSATLPLEWIVVQKNTDPNTVSTSGIPALRDTTKYFDISYYAASGVGPTADVTLPWPDSAGFTDGTIIHYDGASVGWVPNANLRTPPGLGTLVGRDISGDPNFVTNTGVTNFSPFAVASQGSVPVSLSGIGVE